ncbi:hypothetical protein FKP32DRAFT_1675818 [Trametes sanguinea]|nr:hypothetical protein FKP32DRAFT_1675818 [Trametes sanguinea]
MAVVSLQQQNSVDRASHPTPSPDPVLRSSPGAHHLPLCLTLLDLPSPVLSSLPSHLHTTAAAGRAVARRGAFSADKARHRPIQIRRLARVSLSTRARPLPPFQVFPLSLRRAVTASAPATRPSSLATLLSRFSDTGDRAHVLTTLARPS